MYFWYITSGRHHTSLTLVSHGLKINEIFYRNVMLLQQFLLAILYVKSQAISLSFRRTVRWRMGHLGNQLSYP